MSAQPKAEATEAVDDAWDELNAALREYAPPCDGDALFTADRVSAEDRARCTSICGRCLVSDLCDAAATAAKVTSGFWAGHHYSEKGRK
ncbi:hypothetical protein ARHIZOSPH14_27390 [Agromyces rhizosphaerae]|uniref:4Fe-4S Wbl-type domain-containing protein n=1 Tax=Agromyces rhizosphaerae TaxID=88374 RepID=A0A9W6CXL7_9MICO|nr:hypothetical protein ARHIZOSPH14_27390 [Agromyces rhizosphaerae]